MKLPNGEGAIVELVKIRDYCLSLDHPRGRHKARVFSSALGLSSKDAEEFREALLTAAREGNAMPGVSDSYGMRYTIDFEFKRGDRIAEVRCSWIVRTGETAPRFVTCFVL